MCRSERRRAVAVAIGAPRGRRVPNYPLSSCLIRDHNPLGAAEPGASDYEGAQQQKPLTTGHGVFRGLWFGWKPLDFKETGMRIFQLVITALAALAGCSGSFKNA